MIDKLNEILDKKFEITGINIVDDYVHVGTIEDNIIEIYVPEVVRYTSFFDKIYELENNDIYVYVKSYSPDDGGDLCSDSSLNLYTKLLK